MFCAFPRPPGVVAAVSCFSAGAGIHDAPSVVPVDASISTSAGALSN
jgi:hypothetical protein